MVCFQAEKTELDLCLHHLSKHDPRRWLNCAGTDLLHHLKCTITQIYGQLCSGSVCHWSLDRKQQTLDHSVPESLACLVESGSVL